MPPAQAFHLLFLVFLAEHWKPVPGWPAYRVSTWGRVKSFWKRLGSHGTLRYVVGDAGKLMIPGVAPKTGHIHYVLSDKAAGRRQWTVKPSRLVLTAFDRAPAEGEEARHYFDHDPSNNFLWNLCWGSRSDNMRDIGRQGRRHPAGRLTADDVRGVRRLLREGLRPGEIATKYGVDVSNIKQIRSGRIWSYVV